MSAYDDSSHFIREIAMNTHLLFFFDCMNTGMNDFYYCEVMISSKDSFSSYQKEEENLEGEYHK